MPRDQSTPQGDSTPLRIPLATNLRNRGELYTIDARMINCYAEVQEKDETWIYKRPGLVPFLQPAGAPASGLGIFNYNGDIYSVFGSTFFRNGTAQGTVDASAPYKFSSTLGASPVLFFHNGVHYYQYNPSTFTFTAITPGTFTITQPGCAYLDGTMYVLDANGNIFGSNFNDVTTWNPANLIKAQIEPQIAVALSKQLVYVIAFKQGSVEMFYDAGNATGSPLGSVPGQKLNYGLRHAGTLSELVGVLLWVDQIDKGGMSVRVMDQLTAQPCSTPQVEKLLQRADRAGYFNAGQNVYSWAAKLNGHMFYVLTVQGLNVSLVYDLSQKLWYEWTDSNGNYMPIVDSTYVQGQTLVQGQVDGWIYELDATVGTDHNVNIPNAEIYTPEFDGGTRRRKMISKMRFLGDIQPGTNLQVRTTDDDYKSWSGWRNVDMGQLNPQLDNCGTFHRRVWHIKWNSANGGRILRGLEPELDVGDI